jgi:hypothetical protein
MGIGGGIGVMAMGRAAAALFALGLVGASALGGHSARAQQFSADLVTTDPAGAVASTSGRLFAADHKVRIETPDLPDSFLIVDGAVPAAYLVRPGQRIFMEARQSSRLTQIFVPLDPDDPCRQWQVMAEVAAASGPSDQWRCDLEGRESLDGRDTVRYRVTSSQQRRSSGWIDPQLRFPVRIQAEDGAVVELRNIQEKTQPPGRFEIPRDYRKFDPLALIERIKQSDVWVEPPR